MIHPPASQRARAGFALAIVAGAKSGPARLEFARPVGKTEWESHRCDCMRNIDPCHLTT